MDKAYEGDACRAKAEACGMRPVVPPKGNRREPWEYDKELYKGRNVVERHCRNIKQFRRVFTQYDKRDITDNAFTVVIRLRDPLDMAFNPQTDTREYTTDAARQYASFPLLSARKPEVWIESTRHHVKEKQDSKIVLRRNRNLGDLLVHLLWQNKPGVDPPVINAATVMIYDGELTAEYYVEVEDDVQSVLISIACDELMPYTVDETRQETEVLIYDTGQIIWFDSVTDGITDKIDTRLQNRKYPG